MANVGSNPFVNTSYYIKEIIYENNCVVFFLHFYHS